MGYMLWLRHLERGEIPGFAEIGRDVGEAIGSAALTGQAVSGWLRRDEAPDSYRNNKALAAVLGADEVWLIDGNGDAPRPELWAVWAEARGYGAQPDDAHGHSPPRGARLEPPPIPAERPSTKKKDRSA